MELIDTSYGTGSQSETLTRVYRHAGGDLIQVVVHHDAYKMQSYAVASVFAHDRSGWQELVTAPASTWFDLVDRRDAQTHHRTADQLAKRAEVVLDAAPEGK
jgi:hypothetical protein